MNYLKLARHVSATSVTDASSGGGKTNRPGEVMQAVEARGVGAFGGDLALGACQVERGGGAASGGLDLDQAFGADEIETLNIVASAVAAFLTGPLDLVGEVGAVGGDEAGALVVEDALLAREAKCAVAVVSGGGVEPAD